MSAIVIGWYSYRTFPGKPPDLSADWAGIYCVDCWDFVGRALAVEGIYAVTISLSTDEDRPIRCCRCGQVLPGTLLPDGKKAPYTNQLFKEIIN